MDHLAIARNALLMAESETYESLRTLYYAKASAHFTAHAATDSAPRPLLGQDRSPGNGQAIWYTVTKEDAGKQVKLYHDDIVQKGTICWDVKWERPVFMRNRALTGTIPDSDDIVEFL